MKTIRFKFYAWATLFMMMFPVNSIFSQENDNGSFTEIKGQIIDAKSKKPLNYVFVSAVGTNVGSVSNADGQFTLKIDNALKAETVAFSTTGYKNLTMKITDCINQKNLIEMEAVALILDEITVRPNDAYFIVEEMLNKVGDNYSRTPNDMTAFYRETVKQRKRYVSISEAVVDVYKAPYTNALKDDQARLYKGRKSNDVKKQDTILFKLQGGPDGILLMDIIKNPYVLFADGKIALYNFEIEEAVSIDGRTNFVISFVQKNYVDMPLYFGKLFIDMDTRALSSAEFSLNISDKYKAAQLFIRKKPLGMTITPETTSYIVKYKQQDNKFYFNYARNEVTFKVDWKRRLFKSYYTIMSEIAVTDRTPEAKGEIARNERLKSNIVFNEKISAFADPDFWGEYNTIQPDESIEAAIKKYGKRLSKEKN